MLRYILISCVALVSSQCAPYKHSSPESAAVEFVPVVTQASEGEHLGEAINSTGSWVGCYEGLGTYFDKKNGWSTPRRVALRVEEYSKIHPSTSSQRSTGKEGSLWVMFYNIDAQALKQRSSTGKWPIILPADLGASVAEKSVDMGSYWEYDLRRRQGRIEGETKSYGFEQYGPPEGGVKFEVVRYDAAGSQSTSFCRKVYESKLTR